jgi:hypothetical protein
LQRGAVELRRTAKKNFQDTYEPTRDRSLVRRTAVVLHAMHRAAETRCWSDGGTRNAGNDPNAVLLRTMLLLLEQSVRPYNRKTGGGPYTLWSFFPAAIMDVRSSLLSTRTICPFRGSKTVDFVSADKSPQIGLEHVGDHCGSITHRCFDWLQGMCGRVRWREGGLLSNS